MTADNEFDVVVAGAGMTGATLALGLAQAGLSVAVVDAQPLETRIAPEFDGRASAVAYANFRQWRALGLAGTLEPVAQPIRSILVTDGPAPGAASRAPGSAFLRFEADEIPRGASDGSDDEPLGWMIENRHIRAALAQALSDAGAAAFTPAGVVGVSAGARLAEVTLSDGRTLAAPLVVGAEGRASMVREAAGIGVTGWDYRQSGLAATVALERPHDGVAHQYFMPGGPLAVLPLTGDRASLVWTERRDRAAALAAGSQAAFESHLARRFGEALGAPRLLGPRFVHPLSLQLAHSMMGARTALAGDAAHAIHPLAGQGLNMGLKDAAALAEVVADAVRLGEDWGSAAVLERYARWRRFDSMGVVAATDAFTRLFSNDHPLTRAVRGAGLSLVGRLPAARRFFMREAGGAVGDLPRLLRGERLA
jgi:2-octaprenyl-6-methoxyphenol hydroxylase